jgi:protein gp37
MSPLMNKDCTSGVLLLHNSAMAASAIEWTEVTWNPTTGCDRTSPGCDHCYALTLAKRLKAMGQAKYQRDGDPRTSGPGFGLTLHPDTLEAPLHWSGARVVFVNSMSDLFHDQVPLEFIQRVFEVIEATPQHTYQVLTKRSKRLALLANELPWPSNLWMGVSVETQSYTFRVSHLLQVPAAVRFLSVEPMLGPVQPDLTGIGWVIAGGESGPYARPVGYQWVAALRDLCVGTGTPFFFKQWGGRTPKSRGRVLDACTWDQMPTVSDQ